MGHSLHAAAGQGVQERPHRPLLAVEWQLPLVQVVGTLDVEDEGIAAERPTGNVVEGIKPQRDRLVRRQELNPAETDLEENKQSNQGRAAGKEAQGRARKPGS